MKTFGEMNGVDGNLAHQGIWKAKQEFSPKTKPSLPLGKKNVKGQLITNPEELKKLYLDTFKYRLRHRPVQPGFEDILKQQEELFNLRLEVLKSLETGKCRDPEGMVRELFKDEVTGDDLKESLLMLLNNIKATEQCLS